VSWIWLYIVENRANINAQVVTKSSMELAMRLYLAISARADSLQSCYAGWSMKFGTSRNLITKSKNVTRRTSQTSQLDT
jgi:hypothetical protein